MALDPVTKDNGALEFVLGSHLWRQWFQLEPFAEGGASYDVNSDYIPMRDIEAEREQIGINTWEMQPGDVIAFHGLVVQGSKGNFSTIQRR